MSPWLWQRTLAMQPQHPSNPLVDTRPAIAITRSRSGQRMWSDPVAKTQRAELAHLRPFAPAMHYNDFASNRTVAAPIAAAVCGDIPLRPLPSTLMTHFRGGVSNNLGGRFSNNVINSIHDLDLYENEHHAYDAYASHPAPRVMRQAPKLLTLDDYNLISLGYKPVMARRLPWISLTGISITAANVFSGIIPLYGFTVTNGGPAWATWSYFFVGLMSIVVSLCLSELASAYPTTAGVHHWVYQLGSSRRRAQLSWMVGWFTIVSAVTVTASIAFYFSSTLGQLLQSVNKISLTSTTLVMFHLGALFAWQLVNLVPIRGIGYLSNLSSVYILALAVALISAMLSQAGFEPSMGHVPFTTFLNYSGSSSAVYAALSSTLMASLVFCPQDTVIRMAEESRRPERTMPRLMVGSSISNLLAGLPLIIVLNYGVIKPIKGLLNDSIPGVRVIVETLGDYSGTVFVSMVLVAMFSTGVIRLSMATRTVYAFARDGGVPHSSYWNHLHPQRKTPQRVSWLVTIVCMGCIFPYFWGNTVAFRWIASLGCISANICFVVPLWMRLTREGSLHFIPGNFTLGRFSRPLHIVSIIWLLALSLFLMLPPTFPLSKNNFNYAPVVLIVLSIVFGVSWFKARTDFTGGAKDISRASHRIPSQDHSPRKQHYFELETLGSDDGTRLSHQTRQQQQASLSTLHKLRSPVVEKSKARYGHNFGTNSGSSNRSSPLPQNIRRPPLSLISSTRRNHADISASALVPKRRQRKQHKISPETASKLKLAGHPQRGQLGSNLTMTSMASNQSHPSSILGIPFSESPEMMHRELVVNDSSPASSLESDAVAPQKNTSHAHTTESPTPESSSKGSGLVLTRSFMAVAKGDGRALPEIKIASPMTDSTADETTARGAGGGKAAKNSVKHRKAGVQQQEAAPVGSKFPPAITFQQDGVFYLSSMSSGAQAARPANAIDSIFKQGFGLSDQLTGKKSDASGMLSDYGIRQGKARLGKDRAPTPYPASIVDGDDGGISDYTGSMVDTAHLFSASTVALPTLHLKHGKKYEGTAKNRVGKPSTEEVVSGLDISLPFESVSRFPTLDGYPLLKSPTTEYMDVKYDGLEREKMEDLVQRQGNVSGKVSDELRLPTMLPLNRTPTIELGGHEHGALFKMEGGSDSEGIGNFSDALAADDSYETEYNNYYPVISILKSRLHALTTVNASFQASSSSSSLFRLPNRDISAAAGEVPLSSFITSSGSGGEGESCDAATATRSRPLPPLPVQKQDQDKRERQQLQQRQSEERHDPIERLLNLNRTLEQPTQPHQNAHADQQLPQEQQQLSDPTQQQLQRTRSVASWAQEQALIQEKRAMHRARIEALKELRKHDPAATLSMHSDDSFEFSEVLSLSSPPWSSSTASAAAVGVTRSPTHSSSAGGKSRKSGLPSKQNQMANSSALEPLSEDDSLHLSRLEIVVREQEKDEDEQPGIYADTDDLLSPSIEVESLGAGVGRPSFRK